MSRKNSQSVTPRKLSTLKKSLFALTATLLFFGTLEILLAVLGLGSVSATNDPFVGFANYVPLFVKSTDGDATPKYVTAENKLRWFNRQSFPVTKESHTYRIFCLGGSTTYGHPYDDKTSFGGWLRELLPEVDSSKKWEVINCGGISYASYRVAKLMEELLDYEPDLFIIYTGHNEFLEARTYGQLKATPSILLGLGAVASRTRTFAFSNKLMQSVRANGENRSNQRKSDMLSAEVNTLLDSAIGPDVFHRDDVQRNAVFQHFEFNLRRMVDLARQKGAKTILVTPASNIGDCSPFKSELRIDLVGAQRQEWQSALDRAQKLNAEHSFSSALSSIDRAIELDSRHAESLYLRAKILASMGEYFRAKVDFLRARDEDVCTLRAPRELIENVRKVAHDLSVPLVDFVEWTEKNSVNAIPGDSLFLDHVHGTIEVYRDLAIMLVSAMGDLRAIPASPQMDKEKIASASSRIMSRIDSTERGLALRNISKVYSWAGKKDDADRVAMRAMELIPEDADTVYQAANAQVRLGNIDEGIRLYEKVVRLNPTYAASTHASLGFAYASKGDETKCIEHYQRALEINPDYTDIHYNLATVFERRNELAKAEDHYKKAITQNPKHFQSQYRLGLVYAMRSDWGPARVQFLEAIRLNPNALQPHIGLGQVLAILGDRVSARKEFQWVLDRSPNNKDAIAEIQRLGNR